MKFLDAIESGLKKAVTFSGRASRSEYWYFILFYWIFMMANQLLSSQLQAVVQPHTHQSIALVILALVAQLILLVCLVWLLFALISIIVRRLHDVNHSGWWYWITFTIIGALFPLLYWKCSKGTVGDNRFGPDPLQTIEG